jgi:anti-anti-sigma factor
MVSDPTSQDTAMPNPLPYLDARIEQGVLVLTITRRQIEGEDVAAHLKEDLLAAVTQHGVFRVVLDLSNTCYVSSIAFWPLLRLRQFLKDREGRLIVCGLSGAVHDVFTSTRMVSASGAVDAPFEVAPDRDIALARLRADSPASRQDS